MTPQELAILTKLFELIGNIGGLPLGMFFLVVVGPYVLQVILFWFVERGQNHRVQEIRLMYENNVGLVKEFSRVAQSLERLVDDQQGYMLKHTEALTALTTNIRANQYCPAVRTDKKTVEVKA